MNKIFAKKYDLLVIIDLKNIQIYIDKRTISTLDCEFSIKKKENFFMLI